MIPPFLYFDVDIWVFWACISILFELVRSILLLPFGGCAYLHRGYVGSVLEKKQDITRWKEVPLTRHLSVPFGPIFGVVVSLYRGYGIYLHLDHGWSSYATVDFRFRFGRLRNTLAVMIYPPICRHCS